MENFKLYQAPDDWSHMELDIDLKLNDPVFALYKFYDFMMMDLPWSKSIQNVPPIKSPAKCFTNLRFGCLDKYIMRMTVDLKKLIKRTEKVMKEIDRDQYQLMMNFSQKENVLYCDLNRNIRQSFQLVRNQNSEILILIDPGHGGADPGAIGLTSYEKNVVLQISKTLKYLIDQTPGMRAELTRTGDYYVSLDKRVEIARKNKADLLISIHADGFQDQNARGATVYALSRSEASNEKGKWLNNKKKSEDLLGGLTIVDKDDRLAEVLLDLSITKTVNESTKFGQAVLKELKKIGMVHSQFVEPANFTVLKSPDIPSILIETAYITNQQEETLLKNSYHQKKIANAILSGIQCYLKENNNFYNTYAIN